MSYGIIEKTLGENGIMEKKISVLMGVYNCSATLAEAINCIINQSYSNWELIICDDCSQDDTYEKAISFKKLDSRIIVIRNEKNLTLAPTLNHCLLHATGEYVARMDGDDICDDDRLRKEIEFLELHKEFDLVSCQMQMFDSKGVYRVNHPKEFPDKKDLVYGPPFCHAGCMIRTDVLRAVGGYNTSKDVERIEDYDLWFRLYKNGFCGANIIEPLYSMRDDRTEIKRSKMKHRRNSFHLRKKIIKEFHLPKRYYLRACYPILVGLLPSFAYRIAHKLK